MQNIGQAEQNSSVGSVFILDPCFKEKKLGVPLTNQHMRLYGTVVSNSVTVPGLESWSPSYQLCDLGQVTSLCLRAQIK